MAKSKLTIVERFWAKVNKDGSIPAHCPELGPCHVWLGSKNSQGYGRFRVGERHVCTHRFAWELVHDPIPEGLCALHKCDNASCVRESHLFIGTKTDNMQDMIAKNRKVVRRGDQNGTRLHPERLARGNRNGSRLHPDRLARGDRKSVV